ncbi:MAG: hypothetical protein FWD64_06575 [Acidobacteriaceae bacterium]|nr:hypothetical protein [Acidobacteriaceae bacterium]
MALARSPKSTEDKRAEALIDRAAAVHRPKTGGRKATGRTVAVSLRIPEEIVDFIDEEIAAMEEPRPYRHTWLLQAVYAKYRAAQATKEEPKATRKSRKD